MRELHRIFIIWSLLCLAVGCSQVRTTSTGKVVSADTLRSVLSTYRGLDASQFTESLEARIVGRQSVYDVVVLSKGGTSSSKSVIGIFQSEGRLLQSWESPYVLQMQCLHYAGRPFLVVMTEQSPEIGTYLRGFSVFDVDHDRAIETGIVARWQELTSGAGGGERLLLKLVCIYEAKGQIAVREYAHEWADDDLHAADILFKPDQLPTDGIGADGYESDVAANRVIISMTSDANITNGNIIMIITPWQMLAAGRIMSK